MSTSAQLDVVNNDHIHNSVYNNIENTENHHIDNPIDNGLEDNSAGIQYMDSQDLQILQQVWQHLQSQNKFQDKLVFDSHLDFLYALNLEARSGEEGSLFTALQSYIDAHIENYKFLNISVVYDLCALLKRTEDPDFTETSLASVCCVSGKCSNENIIISDRNISIMLARSFAPFAQAYWLLKHGWIKHARDANFDSASMITAAPDEDNKVPCEILSRALLCVLHSLIVTDQNTTHDCK